MINQLMPTIYEAALAYVRKGFSIIPCDGKKAAIPWAVYQKRTTRAATVEQWERAGLLKNVAIICGEISGNLAVIDLDGDDAIQAFGAQFPGMFETYTVRSGSGHGAHLYFRVDDLPKTTRAVGLVFGNIELRANGCYIVAPPSIHPTSGMPYMVSNRQPIRRALNLKLLVRWIEDLNRSKQTPAQTPPVSSMVSDARATRWAQAALAAECASVRSATKGSRNHALNRAAFKMGQLVADGKLSRADVEARLNAAAAALITEDGESTVNRTIRSGIEAGLTTPRSR